MTSLPPVFTSRYVVDQNAVTTDTLPDRVVLRNRRDIEPGQRAGAGDFADDVRGAHRARAGASQGSERASEKPRDWRCIEDPLRNVSAPGSVDLARAAEVGKGP